MDQYFSCLPAAPQQSSELSTTDVKTMPAAAIGPVALEESAPEAEEEAREENPAADV